MVRRLRLWCIPHVPLASSQSRAQVIAFCLGCSSPQGTTTTTTQGGSIICRHSFHLCFQREGEHSKSSSRTGTNTETGLVFNVFNKFNKLSFGVVGVGSLGLVGVTCFGVLGWRWAGGELESRHRFASSQNPATNSLREPESENIVFVQFDVSQNQRLAGARITKHWFTGRATRHPADRSLYAVCQTPSAPLLADSAHHWTHMSYYTGLFHIDLYGGVSCWVIFLAVRLLIRYNKLYTPNSRPIGKNRGCMFW